MSLEGKKGNNIRVQVQLSAGNELVSGGCVKNSYELSFYKCL